MYLRQSGKQKTEHGYESYHHTEVLPHIIHTFLQEVKDPRRPIDAQGFAHCWNCPVGGVSLSREVCSGHSGLTGSDQIQPAPFLKNLSSCFKCCSCDERRRSKHWYLWLWTTWPVIQCLKTRLQLIISYRRYKWWCNKCKVILRKRVRYTYKKRFSPSASLSPYTVITFHVSTYHSASHVFSLVKKRPLTLKYRCIPSRHRCFILRLVTKETDH